MHCSASTEMTTRVTNLEFLWQDFLFFQFEALACAQRHCTHSNLVKETQNYDQKSTNLLFCMECFFSI